jgi:hypothetical protein
MAVDRYGLDPSKTYIEFTWWNEVFKPMIDLDSDGDGSSSWSVLVFGNKNCNTFNRRSDGIVVPTGFWVYKDAVYIDQVIHRPTTLKWLIDDPMLLEHDEVRFLFANSPVNYHVNINPFNTKVYRNMTGNVCWRSMWTIGIAESIVHFSELKPNCIEFIDDNHLN